MVKTRPILLEDHLYPLRLVQDKPVLRFGKPDLFQTI